MEKSEHQMETGTGLELNAYPIIDEEELRDAATFIMLQAHAGQVDKAGEPYFKHPFHVSLEMNDLESEITALLHDVLEDSDFTAEQLRDRGIPSRIVQAVQALTKPAELTYMDYIGSRVASDSIAVKVKIADLKHNMDLRRFTYLTSEERKRQTQYQLAYAFLKTLEEEGRESVNTDKNGDREKLSEEGGARHVTAFYVEDCPYCIQARKALRQLLDENINYAIIPFNWVNEEEHPEIAANYSYCYVPAMFVGDTNIYEVHACESYDECYDSVKAVLDAALATAGKNGNTADKATENNGAALEPAKLDEDMGIEEEKLQEAECAAGFSVNYMELLPGVYLLREDTYKGCDVTTFDLIMTAPNREPVIDMPALHTIEHLGTAYLRNSDRKNELIYFGPMACRTGFHLIVFGSPEPTYIHELVTGMCEFIIEFEGEIPSAKPEECGNYFEHNLGMAKHYIQEYLNEIRENARFDYPN